MLRLLIQIDAAAYRVAWRRGIPVFHLGDGRTMIMP
jgi:hypothetical protein